MNNEIILVMTVRTRFLDTEIDGSIIGCIIIVVIFKCYFSREHIALSHKKLCEYRIRKNQQIKGTAHDGKSYLK